MDFAAIPQEATDMLENLGINIQELQSEVIASQIERTRWEQVCSKVEPAMSSFEAMAILSREYAMPDDISQILASNDPIDAFQVARIREWLEEEYKNPFSPPPPAGPDPRVAELEHLLEEANTARETAEKEAAQANHYAAQMEQCANDAEQRANEAYQHLTEAGQRIAELENQVAAGPQFLDCGINWPAIIMTAVSVLIALGAGIWISCLISRNAVLNQANATLDGDKQSLQQQCDDIKSGKMLPESALLTSRYVSYKGTDPAGLAVFRTIKSFGAKPGPERNAIKVFVVTDPTTKEKTVKVVDEYGNGMVYYPAANIQQLLDEVSKDILEDADSAPSSAPGGYRPNPSGQKPECRQ